MIIHRQNIKQNAFKLPEFLCLLVQEYTVPLFYGFVKYFMSRQWERGCPTINCPTLYPPPQCIIIIFRNKNAKMLS